MRRALAAAPAFASALAAAATARAEPPDWPEPAGRTGFGTGFGWEAGFGPMGAAYPHRPGFAAGVSAYAGLRFTHGADAHHYEGGLIFGERWGADVRAHAWRDAAARAVDASSIALGVAPTLHNVFGDFGTSKGRGPALFGVLLPELGWAYRPRSKDSLYTVHTVPLACFLRDGFMLEAAGKAWVFYGSDVGPSEAMLSLTISVLYLNR